MKKIFSILFALFMAVSVCNAQGYVGNKLTDNISVGLYGGVQTNLHDWNAPRGAVAGITVDKQITPMVGFTLESGVGINNLHNWNSTTSRFEDGRKTTTKTAIDQMNAIGSVRFNLTNIISGYKNKPYPIDIETVLGVGYMHTYMPGGAVGYDDIIGKAGFNINFNLGEERQWTFRIQPSVIYAATNTNKDVTPYRFGLDCRKAVGQITAGIIYHFKSSNNKRHMTKFEPQEILIETPVEITKEVVKEVVKEVPMPIKDYTVRFDYGSAEINEMAKTILNTIPTNTKVKIDGYASYDGRNDKRSFNQSLSEQRAKNVAEYLIQNNVFVTDAIGNGENEIGRVVVITVE